MVAGLAVYLILSYLFVPDRVAIPLAIIISTLIFGLSRYYATLGINDDNNGRKVEIASTGIIDSNLTETKFKQNQQHRIHRKEESEIIDKSKNNDAFSALSNLLLAAGYAASLLIVTAYFFIFSSLDNEIFVPWEQFTLVQIIELGAAIALSFFLPGYALVSTFYRESDNQIRPLQRFLLAYLLSSLITGLTGSAAASLGFGLEDTVELFIVVYLTILIVLFFRLSLIYDSRYELKYPFANLSFKAHTLALVTNPICTFLRTNNAEFVVFASLFALIVLSTYSLYSGAIIGDQWYHHGRSLAYMSGEFIDLSIAGADDKTFSPFPSSSLASFFSVSGIPSVNAYASLGFLNIIPVFSFYYFFKNWVPNRMKRGALLASTLFMLSSGFGWVYVVDLSLTDPPESQLSALQVLYQAGIKSVDIILPTSFIGTAHPDFSSPLIITAIPAGFTMLGLLREKINKNGNESKIKYFAILLSLAILGILSHDEFYLFIIIVSIIPLFLFSTGLRDEKKKNFVIVYGALLVALLIIILAGFSFARGYFIYNSVLGLPVIILCFIFVTITSILYIATRFFYSLLIQKRDKNNQLLFRGLLSRLWRDRKNRKNRTLAPGLVLIFIMAWLYAISFVVWSELSVEAVEIQTHDYSIPWYLYPVKLGVTGLLGLAFIISYLFKKFEKEIFVFGIIVLVAFVTGPYYDEHRFSKYIMAGLAGLGSLFIYSVIIKSLKLQRNIRFRVLAISLTFGIVTLSSSLSILMFWGYNASALDSDFDKALGRRDFPAASEFDLFRLIRNDSKGLLAFNVAAPSDEYSFHTGDLIGKVQAFSGIPWTKLTQSPLTLNASTLEGFYDLLHQSDTRYIILPKEDFVNPITEPEKYEEIEIMDKGKQQEADREELRVEDTTVREEQRGAATTTGVLRFALENFQTAYEDDKYLVLAVPYITPPQSRAEIGLIIPKSDLFLSSLLSYTNNIVLQYDNHSFKQEEIGDLLRSGKIEIEPTSSILYGDKGGQTALWSNLLKQHQLQNANYIEATFRIVGENKTSNDAGIMWNDGNKEYTTSVRNDRLEILVKPTDVSDSKEPLEKKLINVREIKRENGVWYTLKVINTDDHVNIYINDILTAQVPRDSGKSHSKLSEQVAGVVTNAENGTSINSNSNPSISRVGLFSFNNIVEFKPIEIRQVLPQLYEKDRDYFEHYYPLNILSLSKLNYETFMEGDLSAFSKKIVVMDMNSFSHLYSSTINATGIKLSVNTKDSNLYIKDKATDYNSTDSKFLEFVKKGGTLIITNIVNPDSNYFPNEDILQNNELGELFSIQAGDKIKFNKIVQGQLSDKSKEPRALQQSYQNISGVARDIKIKNTSSSSSDFKVISVYVHNNNEVAPFAVEKNYGAGKVIVVNSGGYFNAIASSPKQYFQTLAQIPNLINLNTVPRDNNHVVTDNTLTPNAAPIARVVGDLKVSGHSVINSSSLSMFANKRLDSGNNFDNGKFHVQSIAFQSISENGSEGRDSRGIIDTKHILQNDNYTIFNTVVRDLKLSGEYEVIINMNGSLVLPATLASYYDYIAASIPTGSNMIIRLNDEATAEFIAENGQHGQPVRFTGEAKISFYNVRDFQDKKKDISLLLKSPEIKVITGRANFEKLYMYDPYSKISTDGGLLDAKGSMVARFDHVDNYNEIDSKGGWINTHYLTYLRSIHFGKDNIYNNDKKINLEFPADISAIAKKEGVLVPWQSALLSSTSILTSFSIIVVAATLIAITWRPRRTESK